LFDLLAAFSLKTKELEKVRCDKEFRRTDWPRDVKLGDEQYNFTGRDNSSLTPEVILSKPLKNYDHWNLW